MVVKVIIQRTFKEGNYKEAANMLIRARQNAMQHDGYISSETLSNCDNPNDIVVLSMWESRKDWWRYKDSQARKDLEREFESLMEGGTRTTAYDMGMKR
ncbi:MAG: antibiotic biosynthesis monooxygenase [Desulfobacterales bacterium]|nr:antibiotic biosynthesis monooxygenase [Desulfobacterales bacterium]